MPGMTRRHLFTSESVTEGHPDKVADQISDGVLDAVLRDDPTGRVACETLVNTGLVVVSGEITTTTYVDIQEIARELHYRTDRSAAGLRTRRSRTLALLLFEELPEEAQINPFFLSMLGNITRAAEEVGMYRQNFQQKMRELGIRVDDAVEGDEPPE